MSIENVKMTYERRGKKASLMNILNLLIKFCDDAYTDKNYVDSIISNLVRILKFKIFLKSKVIEYKQVGVFNKNKKRKQIAVELLSWGDVRKKIVLMNVVQMFPKLDLLKKELKKHLDDFKSEIEKQNISNLPHDLYNQIKFFENKTGFEKIKQSIRLIIGIQNEIFGLIDQTPSKSVDKEFMDNATEFIKKSELVMKNFADNCSDALQEINKDLYYISKNEDQIVRSKALEKTIRNAVFLHKKIISLIEKIKKELINDSKKNKYIQEHISRTFQKIITSLSLEKNLLPVDKNKKILENDYKSMNVIRDGIVYLSNPKNDHGEDGKNFFKKAWNKYNPLLTSYQKKLKETIKELTDRRND